MKGSPIRPLTIHRMKLALGAVLIVGCIAYLVVGEEKVYGLAAGVLAAFACRFLAIDPPPEEE